MSALQERKRKEAAEAMRQANKLLEKTMFRWHPDYLAAAPLFEKAAESYRSAGDWVLARRAFAQAAMAQDKNKSPFRAAQACENAAKISLQQLKETPAPAERDKLTQELLQSYEAACGYYGDMGELGKAADALLKGAASTEELGLPATTIKDLYLRACSLLEAQQKPHFAIDAFRKALAFTLKNELWLESLGLLKREVALFEEIGQRTNIHKCFLSQLVIHLSAGDVAAADKAYMEHLQVDDYLNADECALADDLVRAFKTGNEELLQQTIRKQGFSFLDNQVGRLVRKLSIYGGATGSSRTASATARTNSRGGGGGGPRTGSGTSSSASRNPFAPKAKAASSTAPTADAVAAAPAAAVATSRAATERATVDADFDLPTESMASMTVTSEDDHHEFDFDSLEFSDNSAAVTSDSLSSAAAPASASASEAATTPAPAAPAAQEDDMLDLT